MLTLDNLAKRLNPPAQIALPFLWEKKVPHAWSDETKLVECDPNMEEYRPQVAFNEHGWHAKKIGAGAYGQVFMVGSKVIKTARCDGTGEWLAFCMKQERLGLRESFMPLVYGMERRGEMYIVQMEPLARTLAEAFGDTDNGHEDATDCARACSNHLTRFLTDMGLEDMASHCQSDMHSSNIMERTHGKKDWVYTDPSCYSYSGDDLEQFIKEAYESSQF
jgi:hypothetical protein